METLEKNPFLEIVFDHETQVMFDKWTTETENIDDETYFDMVRIWTERAKACNPSGCVSDLRQMLYSLHPDVQQKLTPVVMEAFMNPKFKKFAIVMSQDFISQLSVEQAIEDAQDEYAPPVETKYFADFEQAKIWVIQP